MASHQKGVLTALTVK